jgi:hypothetical protein
MKPSWIDLEPKKGYMLSLAGDNSLYKDLGLVDYMFPNYIDEYTLLAMTIVKKACPSGPNDIPAFCCAMAKDYLSDLNKDYRLETEVADCPMKSPPFARRHKCGFCSNRLVH